MLAKSYSDQLDVPSFGRQGRYGIVKLRHIDQAWIHRKVSSEPTRAYFSLSGIVIEVDIGIDLRHRRGDHSS
jgi:hypothetical protein